MWGTAPRDPQFEAPHPDHAAGDVHRRSAHAETVLHGVTAANFINQPILGRPAQVRFLINLSRVLPEHVLDRRQDTKVKPSPPSSIALGRVVKALGSGKLLDQLGAVLQKSQIQYGELAA